MPAIRAGMGTGWVWVYALHRRFLLRVRAGGGDVLGCQFERVNLAIDRVVRHWAEPERLKEVALAATICRALRTVARYLRVQ